MLFVRRRTVARHEGEYAYHAAREFVRWGPYAVLVTLNFAGHYTGDALT